MAAPQRERRELTRWIPNFNANKDGLEYNGPPLMAEQMVALIASMLADFVPDEVAFVLLPCAATQPPNAALRLIAESGSPYRVMLLVQERQLLMQDLPQFHDPERGLVLAVNDDTVSLGALMHDNITALRIAPAFAKRLAREIRGALLLDSIRRYAHETGLATLGPSLTNGDDFGVPIRFDYVAEETMADVLSGFRLR